jgi:hypothetical protein
VSVAISLEERHAYIHIVIQFYPPRTVELDLFQGLPHYIVRLVLGLLRRLDDGALVEVALVVNVELAEGILQAKDLALLKLGILSARNAWLANRRSRRARIEDAGATYFCSLMIFMAAELCGSAETAGNRHKK